MNVGAWFALAVAAPMALLAVGAATTRVGASQAAGFWAALLLAPAIVLALRSLESRRFDLTPAQQRDQDLARAFCLTTGQACGLLFVVAAGAPFTGESVAVGLAMAAGPLAVAVANDLWRRVLKPLDERLAPPAAVAVGRDWKREWAEIEQAEIGQGGQPAITPQTTPGITPEITPEILPLPAPRPRPLIPVTPLAAAPVMRALPQHLQSFRATAAAGRPRPPVTLHVQPAPFDEAWMNGEDPPAPEGIPYGGGWISGPAHARRAAGLNGSSRLQ